MTLTLIILGALAFSFLCSVLIGRWLKDKDGM